MGENGRTCLGRMVAWCIVWVIEGDLVVHGRVEGGL